MSANLLVLHEGKPAHVIPLRSRPIQVGRAPGNDLAILEPSISRCHASLWHRDRVTWLVDHSSTHQRRRQVRQLRGDPVLEVGARADLDEVTSCTIWTWASCAASGPA